MYTIFTRDESQVFESQTQATRFYCRAVRECEGSAQDHYFNILDAIIASDSTESVIVSDYGGKVRHTFRYDNYEDCLLLVKN